MRIMAMDVGTSLIKVVNRVKNDPEKLLMKTLSRHVDGKKDHGTLYHEIWTLLTRNEPVTVGLTGTGAEPVAEMLRKVKDVTIAIPDGDPLLRELNLQIAGVRRMYSDNPLPNEFLVVAIGTGLSYTFVKNEEIRPFMFGNQNAGGTMDYAAGIDAMRNLDPSQFDDHCDILLRDVVEKDADDMTGDFVVSAGGAHRQRGSRAASAAKHVAEDLARDLLMMEFCMPDWKLPGTIVVIGTPVDDLPVLRHWLDKSFAKVTTILPHISVRIPDFSRYAGAFGAYEYAQTHAA